MWFNTKTKYPENFNSLLDAIGDGCIVIDSDYKIQMINQKAIEILQIKKILLETDPTCYSLICNQNKICQNCPIAENDIKPKETINLTIEKLNEPNLLIKARYSTWFNFTVLTIKNVTKEVRLLRKIDLSRKEADAKNILLERKYNKMTEEVERSRLIIDHIPDPLIAINKHFEITRQNNASTSSFNAQDINKCHQIFGLDEPCDSCPFEGKSNQIGDTSFKKIHFYKGNYYTERIVTSSEAGGGILFFNETTRQIKLIEEIRNQQNTLTGLVNLSTKMQQEEDIKSVLKFFINTFQELVQSEEIILFIDEARIGSLWFNLQKGISEKEIGQVVREYLSRDLVSSNNVNIQSEIFPFENINQITLHGAHGKRVGFLAFSGDISAKMTEQILLYTESVGSYIHNKQLMQQLEEKANTDPLTGLYNRGYLDSIMQTEIVKYNRFGINYSIVAADVNRLKMVNDNYGHESGDNLINTVAKYLSDSIRKTDVVARTGGDEFVILLTDTIEEEAQKFINRIQSEVFSDLYLDVRDNQKTEISVSFGAAGSDNVKLENLVQIADKRMYADKENYYRNQERYRE